VLQKEGVDMILSQGLCVLNPDKTKKGVTMYYRSTPLTHSGPYSFKPTALEYPYIPEFVQNVPTKFGCYEYKNETYTFSTCDISAYFKRRYIQRYINQIVECNQ